MAVCAQCGHHTLGLEDFCAYHASGHGDDWAAGNRIMCDFLHRGIVSPAPVEPADPSVESLVGALEAALVS